MSALSSNLKRTMTESESRPNVSVLNLKVKGTMTESESRRNVCYFKFKDNKEQ